MHGSTLSDNTNLISSVSLGSMPLNGLSRAQYMVLLGKMMFNVGSGGFSQRGEGG
jgi:hypothetical protein